MKIRENVDSTPGLLDVCIEKSGVPTVEIRYRQG